ncbi:BREX-1 system adenine-specific DNA-methyltransferase PglX [Rhizobium johnstonii]|uniref:BREX-1 system adenine-specific DNA-methyltransferase PglX n=1 Tax=Rhizobium johnstonii TaxID=3019933 RepID=UPI003F9AD7FA
MAINRTALKNYAPQARLDFIQAMTNRAAQFGITKSGVSKGELQGELFIVEGKSFPRAVGDQREKLVERINQTSFEQVMEAVAYTWFNRFLAIRYMELHGYFDHGYRVLSHPKGHKEPEILEEAAHLDLPGLKRDLIVEMKLMSTRDEALYRKMLIAQCNDLYRAMPFLFEKIEDETELLLPENLLQSDSIVRKLVGAIEEAEWKNIEIIGWLYQFYISDKKDQVIGRVVKSEDIPAATQLFTPNWIVKYMVQNSLGAKWLCSYPDSAVRGMMDYYIEPAAQTLEVTDHLAAISPKSLHPESLTLLDPAVGSGHILVEAYDLFKAIYVERGYTAGEAARLILTKNLYGLDIDDRAAQLAGFALLMKGRADDRNLLRDPPKLNVFALQESNKLDAEAVVASLFPATRFELIPSTDLLPRTIPQPNLSVTSKPDVGTNMASVTRELIRIFHDAKTFGSLISVERELVSSLHLVEASLEHRKPGDLFQTIEADYAAEAINSLLSQAKILGRSYDCVVANPPYLNGKSINSKLRDFLSDNRLNKTDIYAAFFEVSIKRLSKNGYFGFMTPFTWMSLQSFSDMRDVVINELGLRSLILPEYHSFFESAYVPICAFTGLNTNIDFNATFYDLASFNGADNQPIGLLHAFGEEECDFRYYHKTSSFKAVPQSIIALSLSEQALGCFARGRRFGEEFLLRQGLITGENERFLRFWYEVNIHNTSLNADKSGKKWFPYQKGGDFRKWYGNNIYVVNWERDGFEIRNFKDETGRLRSRPQNIQHYFKEGGTWTSLTVGKFAMRYVPAGQIYDQKGPMCIAEGDFTVSDAIAAANSSISNIFLSALAPTMDYSQGPVGGIPFIPVKNEAVSRICKDAINISKEDWDSQELSWEFRGNPLVFLGSNHLSLADCFTKIEAEWQVRIDALGKLENENNELHLEAYGLQNEVKAQPRISEITLECNPFYKYGNNVSDSDLRSRLKSDAMRDVISYAVGCMMGRYSLAEPGLIYAHAGREGFDASRYGAFPADPDGIIPITEEGWFEDDAANRLVEFLSVAWHGTFLTENLAFLIDGLIKGRSREPRADLRVYFAKKFYADHLQTYRNRPIYWLFSSGKEKAFECLVYLHRYNEGTLARMRTEYVTPLMGKMLARIEALENEITQSSSSAERSRKTKDATKFRKQLEELRAFDEELRHLADQRIALDLDDGVKVNYGMFGNLLAAKDKVCGKLGDAD